MLSIYNFIFYTLFLSIHIFCKDIFNEKKLETINDLYSKKQYEDVIDICTNILKAKQLNYTDEINLLITLGDSYFENNEKKKCIEVYKLLLNKYNDFEDKEYVLYRLCWASFKRMPRCPYVDLSLCYDLLYYANYSKKYIKNNNYLKEIHNMIDEANEIIEEAKFNDIKFFFEYELYNSAIMYINNFIKETTNKKYINECSIILAKSLYENIKKEIIKIKYLKKNKNSKNIELEKKYYENIIKYINNIRDIDSNNLDKETNIEIDNIFDNSKALLFSIY